MASANSCTKRLWLGSCDADAPRCSGSPAPVLLVADEVRLAREVLEGGRFAIVKAVELAERLLAAKAADGQLLVGGNAP